MPHFSLDEIFPACRRLIPPATWAGFLKEAGGRAGNMVDLLRARRATPGIPPFAGDAARLDLLRHETALADRPSPTDTWSVNPTLTLLKVGWQSLPDLLADPAAAAVPRPGHCLILCWQDVSGHVHLTEARDEDLLALKITTQDIDPRQAAAEGDVAVGFIHRLLERAADRGLLLRPSSRLIRDHTVLASGITAAEKKFLHAEVFTLQWHITQACDLHCRHCYDRSSRMAIPFDRAVAVLDDLYSFCHRHHVRGQVSFTGGNPLLHPRFFDLYREAVTRDFMVAILGNPCDKETLADICAIGRPEYYQVSLEGLRRHNDWIRGQGHFDRVMKFLPLLRQHGIYSMVMLTLTDANTDQVLPLADLLRDKTDLFTFNRLSMVGEGVQLHPPEPGRFRALLEEYEKAAADNPAMAFKDNFFNLLRRRHNRPLFGGCAGHGCGAAFNFLSLLPDGEVHACRKFPSPVGNIFQDDLTTIYHSEAAHRYRQGPDSCQGCAIRHVCGGCLAVTASLGHNITTTRDPYCFVDDLIVPA